MAAAASEAVAELPRLQGEIALLKGEAEAVLRRTEELDAAPDAVTTQALQWLRDRELALARRGVKAEVWVSEMAPCGRGRSRLVAF